MLPIWNARISSNESEVAKLHQRALELTVYKVSSPTYIHRTKYEKQKISNSSEGAAETHLKFVLYQTTRAR